MTMWETGYVVVPVLSDPVMWGGLARHIVMWMDMYDGPKLTPRNLFLLLERTGAAIPQWLRDEPELQALDHVPSKGTRAQIIYRAMIEAAPAFTLTDEMVERGAIPLAQVLQEYTAIGRADGVCQVYGPDDAAGEPSFSSQSEEECAMFIASKGARACLTEAIRAAKGE